VVEGVKTMIVQFVSFQKTRTYNLLLFIYRHAFVSKFLCASFFKCVQREGSLTQIKFLKPHA